MGTFISKIKEKWKKNDNVLLQTLSEKGKYHCKKKFTWTL